MRKTGRRYCGSSPRRGAAGPARPGGPPWDDDLLVRSDGGGRAPPSSRSGRRLAVAKSAATASAGKLRTSGTEAGNLICIGSQQTSPAAPSPGAPGRIRPGRSAGSAGWHSARKSAWLRSSASSRTDGGHKNDVYYRFFTEDLLPLGHQGRELRAARTTSCSSAPGRPRRAAVDR